MRRALSLCLVLLAMASAAYCLTRNEYPHITIYADNERAETLVKIDSLIGQVEKKAGAFFQIRIPQRTLYIYKSQREFQSRKYPIIASFLSLDWYIGDNIKDRALIVSPDAPVRGHSYESIINAIPHEYIHTVVYSLNLRCRLWLNEGLALYLANGHRVSVSRSRIPPMRIFTNSSPLYFQKNNGYSYADKFIEFADAYYGHERLMNLIRSGDYKKELGEDIQAVYEKWLAYLQKMYP